MEVVQLYFSGKCEWLNSIKSLNSQRSWKFRWVPGIVLGRVGQGNLTALSRRGTGMNKSSWDSSKHIVSCKNFLQALDFPEECLRSFSVHYDFVLLFVRSGKTDFWLPLQHTNQTVSCWTSHWD